MLAVAVVGGRGWGWGIVAGFGIGVGFVGFGVGVAGIGFAVVVVGIAVVALAAARRIRCYRSTELGRGLRRRIVGGYCLLVGMGWGLLHS